MRVLQRTISSENRLLADGPGPFTPLLPLRRFTGSGHDFQMVIKHTAE